MVWENCQPTLAPLNVGGVNLCHGVEWPNAESRDTADAWPEPRQRDGQRQRRLRPATCQASWLSGHCDKLVLPSHLQKICIRWGGILIQNPSRGVRIGSENAQCLDPLDSIFLAIIRDVSSQNASG